MLPRTRWRACSQGVLTRRALVHGVCTTQRLAFAAAAASSLLLRPRLVPTRSLRFPRCRGRKGAGLPPRASTARSEVNYFPSISGKLVELDAFGAPSSPRTRSAAHSAPTPRTTSSPMLPAPAHNPRAGPRRASCLVGAAPSRRSMPKLTMPGRRCHRRRQLPLCLLPPPRRLCVCDRRGLERGVRRLAPPANPPHECIPPVLTFGLPTSGSPGAASNPDRVLLFICKRRWVDCTSRVFGSAARCRKGRTGCRRP